MMMSVEVKSSGAVKIDAHLGFENKYITMPHGKLNGEASGRYSIDTTPGIDTAEVNHIWRRYQWDTTITKGHANLDVGIDYRPTDETEVSGNWARTKHTYIKMNLSMYLK